MSEKKNWGFGIVGAGLIADFHAKAIEALENASVKGVFDNVSEKRQSFAGRHGCPAFDSLESMLSDSSIDVITVATPSGAHAEPVIAAARHGKHAVCEKPLDVTLERIDAMIDAHKQAGTQLGCVFQNRFTDAMVPLRKAVEDGRFGTITYAGVYVPWWRTDEYYRDSWHGTWKLDGGGALMNQSIHMIDMLCDLMGPAAEVKAFADSIGHEGIEAEDTAVAVIQFANKALGIVYGTSASFPGQFKRFEITGTKGTAVYLEDSFTVWQFAEEKPEDDRIREKFGQTQGPGGVSDPGNIDFENHRRNFAAFLSSLQEGREFELSGHEGRKAVELILNIYKSAGIR